jgi:uncharacterized membrane protein YdbT with pleckstrin-like domain
MMTDQTDRRAPSSRPSSVHAADQTDETMPRPAPSMLRFVRLFGGLLLLVVALGGIALELILVTNLRDALNHLVPASAQTALVVVLDGVAGLWVLAVVLGCLLIAVMSLALVFTRRG